jgi:hypothetical protein
VGSCVVTKTFHRIVYYVKHMQLGEIIKAAVLRGLPISTSLALSRINFLSYVLSNDMPRPTFNGISHEIAQK